MNHATRSNVTTIGVIFGIMDQVLDLTLSLVGLSLGFFLLAFVAGFAYDLEHAMRAA